MTDGEVGQDINRAISLNNGVFQQLQGIGRGQPALPRNTKLHPELEEYARKEGYYLEEPTIDQLEAAYRNENGLKALPKPQTEREKRVARYRRKRSNHN